MNALEKQLATLLSRNWWVLLLRGLLAIAFGVLAWMQPGITITALALLFGAYAMADGILGIWGSIAGRKVNEDWWILLLWALISIAAGIATFMAPGITAMVLLYFIAAWAIAIGLIQIVSAIRLRKQIRDEWWLILAGLISVAFGALLIFRPGAGAVGMLWVIATYAIFFGILLVFLSFRVRSYAKQAP